MLGKADATPMIAVKDLDRARKFYEETSGLKDRTRMAGGVLAESGDTRSMSTSRIRRDQQGHALTFDVDDIESEVRELKDKGISSSAMICGLERAATSMTARE
jgi:catechol 2,3-dioxygenase-like lactoylglutathione lyase family enzyme